MIRIIHTADNHLGINYSNWKNKDAAQKVSEERFKALERIVQHTNSANADYLVIAGDLFENTSVKVAIIEKCVAVLKKSNVPVVIIPGNHDFYENADNKLWKSFLRMVENTEIILLNDYQPVLVESGEKSVWFYPCFCDNKHSNTSRIHWVERSHEIADAHIGIAHGNLEGLGLGADRYFNMTKQQLLAKNLDLWLLGHIHVPWPTQSSFNGERILMPGTHTPDGYGRIHPGGFFDIKFHDSQNIEVEWIESGAFRFYNLEFVLTHADDILALKKKLTSFIPESTLIKIKLCGRLVGNDLQELNQMLTETGASILDFQIDNKVIKKLERVDINSTYPEESMPFKVLTQLVGMADEEEAALALELGYNLFQKHTIK
jgi:exonuclease SbcD